MRRLVAIGVLALGCGPGNLEHWSEEVGVESCYEVRSGAGTHAVVTLSGGKTYTLENAYLACYDFNQPLKARVARFRRAELVCIKNQCYEIDGVSD